MKIGIDAKRIFNNNRGLGSYGRTLLDNMIAMYPNDKFVLYTPAVSLPRYQSLYDVVTIHDLIFKTHPAYFPATDRFFYNLKWKHSLDSADKIIAISHSTAADIQKYYDVDSDKIEVIYSASHPRYYSREAIYRTIDHLKLPSEYMLSVGSLEPRKNYEGLIRAYANVNREVRGLPINEAMLCSTAVVASQTSSMQEAGGPSTLYVNPDDIDDIRVGIEAVLESEALRDDMVAKGLVYVHSHFDPKKVTTQTVELYQSLL